MKEIVKLIASDFGVVSAEPTQLDADTGIRYDFNCGARLKLPDGDEVWKVQVYNSETNDIYVDEMMPSNTEWAFNFKYFVPYRLEVTNSRTGQYFKHKMNLKSNVVAFKMMQKTLGDPLYMFAAIREFVNIHRCRAIVYAAERINEILREQHPDIEFLPLEEENPKSHYATYYLGLFFDQNIYWQPYDFRTYSLVQQGQHILGLNSFKKLKPPNVSKSKTKPLKQTKSKRYVAISYTGSKQCKFWNNPRGWYDTIKYLNSIGYEAVCIDRDPIYGLPPIINTIPNGAIDLTGDYPLQDRIDVLRQCDFFIGTPSGLAALAWCVDIPVIMISGFSLPFAEFDNYRVINPMCGCIGCWNDNRIDFDRHEMHWCPRIDTDIRQAERSLREEEDSPNRTEANIRNLRVELQTHINRRFICTKSITTEMVIAQINKVIGDYGYIVNKKSQQKS